MTYFVAEVNGTGFTGPVHVEGLLRARMESAGIMGWSEAAKTPMNLRSCCDDGDNIHQMSPCTMTSCRRINKQIFEVTTSFLGAGTLMDQIGRTADHVVFVVDGEKARDRLR